MWLPVITLGLLRSASLGNAHLTAQVDAIAYEGDGHTDTSQDGVRLAGLTALPTHERENVDMKASLPDASSSSRAGLMRREIHAEGEEEEISEKKAAKKKAKGMFKAMDLDQDGLLSMAEVEETVHRSGVHEPKDFHEMLLKLDLDKSGSLDFKEFKRAVYHFYHIGSSNHDTAEKSEAEVRGTHQDSGTEILAEERKNHKAHHARRHHHKDKDAHHMPVNPHRVGLVEKMVDAPEAETSSSKASANGEHHGSINNGEGLNDSRAGGSQHIQYRDNGEKSYAEFIDSSGKVHVTTKTKTHTASDKVSCGGHVATSCSACTTTDSLGQRVADHGAEWCNGDCVYSASACHVKGTVSVDPNAQAISQGYATTEVPDLLNPNLTARDNRTIDAAAEAAIREANLEAAERERKEEEAMQNKKFSWKKFWLIIVITMSAILGLCACCSIIAVVVFCCMTGKKEEPEVPDGEDEGDDEDDGLGDAD